MKKEVKNVEEKSKSKETIDRTSQSNSRRQLKRRVKK